MGMLIGRAQADEELESRERESARMQRFTEGGEAGTLPPDLALLYEQFVARKAEPPKQINNWSLPAGAPMHYYCVACGHKAATLPESHTCAVPQYCAACLQAIEAVPAADGD